MPSFGQANDTTHGYLADNRALWEAIRQLQNQMATLSGSSASRSAASSALVPGRSGSVSGSAATTGMITFAVFSGLSVNSLAADTGTAFTLSTTLSGILKGTGSGIAMATAGTDYEAPLGNPGADGYLLSSTAAGLRSWVAPGGGSSAGSWRALTVQRVIADYTVLTMDDVILAAPGAVAYPEAGTTPAEEGGA